MKISFNTIQPTLPKLHRRVPTQPQFGATYMFTGDYDSVNVAEMMVQGELQGVAEVSTQVVKSKKKPNRGRLYVATEEDAAVFEMLKTDRESRRPYIEQMRKNRQPVTLFDDMDAVLEFDFVTGKSNSK